MAGLCEGGNEPLGSLKVIRDVVELMDRLSPPFLSYRLSKFQTYSAARRIRSTKKTYDPIGNRTRDFRLVVQFLNRDDTTRPTYYKK
ncbi:hypothetical protein ANN_04227 [Periplaneta americana]|uniref:Uncharacterized protein n=1 Tax=Periplaneta americana TaxID=6978 RepID=A0ABQ8T9L2_PERAM|nr:hypothetical protein ANN_04227 [Periplaneta americana]